jgi:hypothetical protein
LHHRCTRSADLDMPSGRAEYIDQFPLVRSMPFVANVDSSGGSTALITVRYVGPKLDELGGRRLEEVAEIARIPPGQRVSVTFPRPGKGVKLAIIEVDTFGNNFASVEIKQGANAVIRGTPPVSSFFRMVFDVVGAEQ